MGKSNSRKQRSRKVALNVPAPDFSLSDISGKVVRIADYAGLRHLLLVFNRGFM